MPDFSHLHVHTQFSLLDGAAKIPHLYKKAIADGMKGMAITDHGNMFGVYKFVAEAHKHKKNPADKKSEPLVKPIIGCEFYLVENRHRRSFTREEKDIRYHQLLLAKNANGYQNLVKLCSLGYTEGMYGKYPRIDKELVEKYHKDLIATTCCLGAIVPKTFARYGEEACEKEFLYWLDMFGEDYFVELQRHDIPEQNKLNSFLVKLARKHNVKIIATNDSHYVEKEDNFAHDILLCINTGEKISTPKIKEFNEEDGIPKGGRFAFYNDEFYFKTQAEMSALFQDIPEAIDNTGLIVDRVETLQLNRDILLPNFPLPANFDIHKKSEFVNGKELVPDVLNQWEYLKHLTFTGAQIRYGSITPEIEERLNFELQTIKNMGFPGYFLIVSDFIQAGREKGVYIGPGRGSAAGSAVAYCTGITNLDPIKYNLLFERFLNPERISMPDIDTDFDDEGRQIVIDYVVEKYGKEKVAQIVTYGTMAAKMSIKDVSRVLDLPLQESNMLAKLVPDKPGISLSRVFNAPLDGAGSLKEKEGLGSEDIEKIKLLRQISEEKGIRGDVLKEAQVLEGSVRNTGVHAAGIIIAPEDLTNILPIATSKESSLYVTQYDGKVVEDAGVIKMDFLGLKTLSIIKDAVNIIQKRHGIHIVPDEIPLDDVKTFELYQKGETIGTFQFESPGMQKYLRELKPDKFEDLIAMNALYRPGPIEYIPNFINRKHGKEKIEYDLPELEEYLAETFGITVYQEQVMLLSQKLADFTKGEADGLRKAMGKKDRATLDKYKPKFLDNGESKGMDRKKLEKIWTDWEAFASYAFNKSHSTCYAFVAFQTAYLKANYPAEYMAAVLNNANSMDKITFLMEECKRMGINVLGPSVNESHKQFFVNQSGDIRFGLGGIKGLGENTVDSILEEREKDGAFKSIFDLAKRISAKALNKKSLEALAYSGAFDCFEEIHRAQYFEADQSGTGIDKIVKFAQAFKQTQDSNMLNLFGDAEDAEIPEPKLPICPPWERLHSLKLEKEYVGMYLSGHPLDKYKNEIELLTTVGLDKLDEYLAEHELKSPVKIAGIMSKVEHNVNQKGNQYGVFVLDDFSGSYKFFLYNADYTKFRAFLNQDTEVFISGSVGARWNSETERVFKIDDIELLQNTGQKYIKSLDIFIDLDRIEKQMILELDNILQLHPGDKSLNFLIQEREAEKPMLMKLPYKKSGVNINSALIHELNSIPGITCFSRKNK